MIELIAIIVVLAILAGVAIPKYLNISDKAYRAMAADFLVKLQSARTMYIGLQGRIPPHLQGIIDADGTPSGLGPPADLISIDSSIRSNFADPGASVLNNYEIQFTYKNGLVARYLYDPASGSFTLTLTGP